MSLPLNPYPDPDIVWESGPCLVVNKPGGLLTQAPPGIDSMELRLRRFLLRRENRTGNIYLATCHRLDRPVAGLLAFVRNVRAAQRLSKQFENRSVLKTYWALVEGTVSPAAGSWTDFMRKVPGEPRSEIVPGDSPDAQLAKLRYSVLRTTTEISLLQIELETGRTHQIRLQTASRGFPIVGDVLYGANLPFGPQTDDLRLRWIGLMARRLRFLHPMTQEIVDLVSPPLSPWRESPHFSPLNVVD
jgi:23S rRNA pseudouridine1911/1915/1917 synthase